MRSDRLEFLFRTRRRQEMTMKLLSATRWLTLCLFFTGAICSAQSGEEELTVEQPFWMSSVMTDEPVLFVKAEGQHVASGRLIFTPAVKLEISSPDGTQRYEEGRDYTWKPGSRRIELTPETRIPFKTAAEMAPGKGKPQTLGGVLWSEGRFFHDLQTLVDYEHNEQWPELVSVPQKRLPRSMAKLRSKQPLKIVALGDSITVGYNASGFGPCKAPRNQPPYPQLVADTLQQHFESTVTLKTLARAGMTVNWGLGMVDKLTQEKPDLVIIAFGMNDTVSPKEFESTMRKLIDAVKAGTPGADIVVVSAMRNNPVVFKGERIAGFRDVLLGINEPNVALADVTTPWLKLLERKSFSDLSGNNFNHPNDFGHRLYAEVICSLFPGAVVRPGSP